MLDTLGKTCYNYIMISTHISVERYTWTQYSRDCPRGSGYCEDQGQYQLLVKRWKFKGFTIWKKVLDREEVPSHVWISAGALGYTDWRSKFAEYI